MVYTTFLGKTYDNEEDETCTREFGDSYKCLKREYPRLWELPKNEIQNMCKIFRTEGDTVEDGYEAVKKYVENKGLQLGDEAKDKEKTTNVMQTMTEAQKQQARYLRETTMPKTSGFDIFKEGVRGFGQGAIYGLSRPLNGASLGAVDWADRRLGGDLNDIGQDIADSTDNVGIGGLNKAVNFGLEVGGNMAGAGGAVLKSLNKGGLSGLKLAGASGGIEGMASGAFASDSWNDVGSNMAIGGIGGGVLGTALPWGMQKMKNLATDSFEQFGRWQSRNNLIKQLER